MGAIKLKTISALVCDVFHSVSAMFPGAINGEKLPKMMPSSLAILIFCAVGEIGYKREEVP